MFWKILSFLLAIVIIILVSNYELIDKLLFSRQEYKNNLIVDSFIMKEEQLCNLFDNDIANQLSNEELLNKQLYIVVCIRNNGKMTAWGELRCVINEQNIINVPVTHIGNNENKAYKFVIPYSGGVYLGKNRTPKITCQWKKLFTK
jgi:hypothetical protein